MPIPSLMLAKNAAWAADMAARDPAFFTRIADAQTPQVLWIGCADSRVPAERITSSQPGDLFVHRNIANLITAGDDNATGAIEYAVRVLKVRHIVVCGHYGCGGVRAALLPPQDDLPAVNRHLAPLRSLAAAHHHQLAACPDLETRVDRLAELSMHAQMRSLRSLPVVAEAETALTLHGWMFSLQNGLLQNVQIQEVPPGPDVDGPGPGPIPAAPSNIASAPARPATRTDADAPAD